MYKYYGMDREEYEEYYGERVIICREHNITSIDGCPACDELEQEIEIGGETVKVDIPMTANFFWPSSQ